MATKIRITLGGNMGIITVCGICSQSDINFFKNGFCIVIKQPVAITARIYE